MRRREVWIYAAAVLVMLGAAGFLASWGERQRLGEPGVVVIPGPFPGMKPGSNQTGERVGVGTNHVALPEVVPGYGSAVMPLDATVWGTLPVDTVYGQRLYTNAAGFPIQNMVVLMGTDRTSIHQPQYCLRGAGWTIERAVKEQVRIPRPHAYDLPVMKLVVNRKFKDGAGRAREVSGVFVYWFVADGRLTNEHEGRMWMLAWDLVTKGVLQRWAYVVCFRPCAPGDEERTFDELKGFLAASVPAYQRTVGSPVEGKVAAN